MLSFGVARRNYMNWGRGRKEPEVLEKELMKTYLRLF